MKLLDKNTSACFKVPELVLMEQAAMHFVWKLCDVLKDCTKKKGIVFCGMGNNGADGIAIARLLNEKGIATEIIKVKDLLKEKGKTSDSFQVQESIYHAYNYPVQTDFEKIKENTYDFVIDAIFGIGLSRNVNEEYRQLMEQVNALSGLKFAVDMPSGINADDGQIMGSAIRCDYTITFSFGKVGQYLWPGCEYAGQVFVADMGITNRSWLDKKPGLAYLEKSDLELLPVRPAHSNKGTFGKVLIIAGNINMAGAACFAAKAAYRSGAGLVKVHTCEENREIIQMNVPEALLSTYSKKVNEELLLEDLKWADAVVAGPGLGVHANSRKIVDIVCKAASVPVVWDADALNIFAENPNRLLLPHTEFVLTPHLGEFSRLTSNSIGWIQSHFIETALDFARNYDVICVLKDFRTVTADPYGLSYLNLSGNNGMATGGSGDVLSGIIGAFLANGMKGQMAASMGVYIHGLAGDYAREKMGTHSIMASDIIEALKEVWKGTNHAK